MRPCIFSGCQHCCRCARPVIIAAIAIYFLASALVLPFEVLSNVLSVFTLGAFHPRTASGGLRAWVTETTSLVPLLALSLLRSGAHTWCCAAAVCCSMLSAWVVNRALPVLLLWLSLQRLKPPQRGALLLVLQPVSLA